MKIYKKGLIVGSLVIVIGLSIFILANNVKGISDIDYTFQQDILYESDDIEFSTTFNTNNLSTSTELYNASYTFTDDIDGNEPEEWETTAWGVNTANISTSLEGHSKVLHIHDENASSVISYIELRTTAATSGTIEFWIYSEDITKDGNMQINSVLNSLNIFLGYDNSYFKAYYDSQWNTAILAIVNSWSHHQIDFECSTGTYEGLTADTFNWYIDGIFRLNGKFRVNCDSIDLFQVGTPSTDSLDLYIDALGYSWDSYYNINNNLTPFFNITSEMVIQKDEFAYDENGAQYDLGDTSASGWIGTTVPAGSIVIYDDDDTFDRTFKIFQETVDTHTLNKATYNYDSTNVFNISISISYLEMNNDDGTFSFNILEQNDADNIVNIYIEKNGVNNELRYQSSGAVITLDTIDITANLNREINLFVNRYMCILTYWDENTPIITYYFDNNRPNGGFGRILISSSIPDISHTQTILLDSVGVFVNGTPIVEDYGFYLTDLDISSWNSLYQNIVEINAIGLFSFGCTSESGTDIIKSFYNYTELQTWNVYDDSFSHLDPYFIFITNETINIKDIFIHGVYLTDGTINYWGNYYTANINNDESYFYGDSDNNLNFKLVCNDNYTEFIEARYDLLYKTTENRSVSFRSDINGVSQGYLHFAYWGYATTDIYFPYYLTTTTVFLPQTYIIFTLSIIISDLDITWYDNCSGYITNLKFVHTPPGIEGIKLIDIDITNLIAILIPMIILLTPTLAISVKFGKKAILPMFVLMSLICVATNLIPVWLFFIIAISTGALMFIQYKSGDD